MYDKSVRARRAVLALLVALSLILLTAYFGESSSGGLHSVQRGVLEVISPIQEGANRALKPMRDLFGWFGDTLDAKDERDELRKQRNSLLREVSGLERARDENVELRNLAGLTAEAALDTYEPVSARVIGRSPTLWFATVTIDKGRRDGVRLDQPVVADEGLVGKVKAVTASSAQVTLITDESSGVSAKVSAVGTTGTIRPEVGNPNDLLLEFIAAGTRVEQGDRVVTAGTSSDRYESLFPPGILIGAVSRVEPEEIELYQRVHVRPAAALRTFDFVKVLTEPAAQVARVP